MNPTDQARKEARKRELKKNKKQRMMVRAAVLKMKDPKQIIKDMEKLDEMEFNPVQQPQLNEKVLKDKRKKLRETFERILRLYEKENTDFYKELRKLEIEYEQKRSQLCQFFDAVKNAQHVEVESIPLPDMPHAPSNIMIQDIPLPGAQPPSILKKTSAYGPSSKPVTLVPLPSYGVPRVPPGKKPPGPPPGPPPPQVLALYGRRMGPPPGIPLKGKDEDNVYDPEIEIQDMQEDEEEEDSGDDDYNDDMEQDLDGDRDDQDEDSDDSKDKDSDDDFRHRDEDDDRLDDDKPGRIVRFADVQDKHKKKIKNLKELTPLQAMMLRMAGQDFPEDEDEEEEEPNGEGGPEEEKMDTEEQSRDKRPLEDSQPEGPQMPPPTQMPPRAPMQAPPMPGPPPLGPPPAPPLRPPGPPSGLPPGPPPGEKPD